MFAILIPCVIAAVLTLWWVKRDEGFPLVYTKIVAITLLVEGGFFALDYMQRGYLDKFIMIGVVVFTTMMFMVTHTVILLRWLVSGRAESTTSNMSTFLSMLFGIYLYVLLVTLMFNALLMPKGVVWLEILVNLVVLYGAIRGAAGLSHARWIWVCGLVLVWYGGSALAYWCFDIDHVMRLLYVLVVLLPAFYLNLRYTLPMRQKSEA